MRSTRSAASPTTCAPRPSADDVTYVINRNINFTNVCYVGCRFCAFAQREVDEESYTLTLTEVADRAQEAWDRGATEVCMQGGIHPDLPGSFYFDLLDAVKRRDARDARPRVQPDGDPERRDEARRLVRGVPRRGEGPRARHDPGHGGRDPRRRRALDAHEGQAPRRRRGRQIVRTAHGLGIRSSSTIMFGHVDAPPHWVAHLRRLGRDPGRHRRVHGVRAAAVRAPQRADLPRGQGAPRRDARGVPADARGRAHPARRADPERAGLLGEARRRRVPGDPARRVRTTSAAR